MSKHLRFNFFSLFRRDFFSNCLFGDLFAGCSVGIISIPLAIAFAIASGVRPEQGLYTAFMAGLIAALFGGCRLQISGPAGTFVLIVFSTFQNYGYEGVVMVTLLAGLILIVMGGARFGALIKFIPYPVVIGFTSGIAVVMAVNQIPDFLGLHLASIPKGFIGKCLVIYEHLPLYQWMAVVIGVSTIVFVQVVDRYFKKIQGTLLVILISSLVVVIFNIPIETIGNRFGEITPGLPVLRAPHFEWGMLFELFPSAFALALLSGIESLLSAMVADGMTGQRHHSNQELIAQGFANFASGLFGGIPACGSLSRTVVNIRSGAKTVAAALICSLFLGGILLFFVRWIRFIPMATLAGIIMIVAYKISDWRHFSQLFRSPKRDIAVLLTTFFLTVFVNLISALEIGIILATFLFVDHASKHVKTLFLREAKRSVDPQEDDSLPLVIDEIPMEIEVFELSGPLFFAAVDKFKTAFNSLSSVPKVLIVRMRNVSSIDASGVHALEGILLNSKKKKTLLFLSGASPYVTHTLKKSGFFEIFDEKFFFKTFDEAFSAAKQLCTLPEDALINQTALPSVVQDPD